ncbi:MAG TPA: hypothetical protein VG228_03095 [Solirubrobacteraceae bacterium]|nr:hypothetical protein [Solirubrobacteraceae bacterium]
MGGVDGVALKVAYGVDAAVDADELLRCNPPVERPLRNPGSEQLFARDVTTLSSREAMHVLLQI